MCIMNIYNRYSSTMRKININDTIIISILMLFSLLSCNKSNKKPNPEIHENITKTIALLVVRFLSNIATIVIVSPDISGRISYTHTRDCFATPRFTRNDR